VLERKHPLAKCEECPLFTVGRFVPSAGPEKAELAFVGEAPGAQEARGGVPFVGPSGKLLDVVMKHHGIEREEVFLTNACLCRPPDNSTPPVSAVAACRDRLDAELAGHGVHTAVALGNTAAQSLLGESGVTKLRIGPPRRAKRNDRLEVVATLHPAAALRQGDLFPHIVNDVAKAVTPPKHWEPPTYVVADDEASALSYMEQLLEREGPLAVDIEVGIDKDDSFDHPNHYDMLSIAICYAKGKVLVLGENCFKFDSVIELLRKLLLVKDLIFQNGKFDKGGLFPLIGEIRIWFDTMLASYTFDERPGVHGLDYQGQEHLGAPNWKGAIKQYVGKGTSGSYANIPRPILYKYNAYDASVTYDLRDWYEARYANEAAGADLRKVHDFLVRASNELVFVELNGFPIDRKLLDELMVSYLDVLEKSVENINEVIGHKDYGPKSQKWAGLNPNSPDQVKAYLKDQGVETESTDEDHIKFILEHPSVQANTELLEFCRALLAHRREAKLYGTYIKGVRKRLYGGRVFPTYLLHGTTSGRLASRNPNVQNIPRGNVIRRLYVPAKEEHVLVGVDYSQAELRVLSYLARDTYFRDIFNAGDEDLFDNLTPILYPGKTRKMMEAGLISMFEWKEMRIRVKAFVYGLAYGRKHFSIAEEYKIPVGEAKTMMDNFFSVIPEIVAFREETMQKVLDGEDLVTPWGRHRRYTLITKENKDKTMNEALSFLPQSTASDMCLDALTELRPALKGIAHIRNTVHDALYLDTHRDNANKVASMTNAQMVASAKKIVGDYVLFKTDAHIANNWGALEDQ
jgi:uracil-DNA glycosylase family 4